MQHWFLFLQEVRKSGQHICKCQGYAFFPNHSKKIQVEDDNNDIFIRKKLESFSEAVRKEAYEKASLEHKQSTDKQDIFLETNDKKDADEIIKAMTPETLTQERTKLLEICNRKNNCVPIKEIQVLATIGVFDSKLASCQPPVFAS